MTNANRSMRTHEWKQRGRVSLWCYAGNPRNYPGWHFNCDEEGASSLIELVRALSESELGEKRTVVLAAPKKKQLSVANCTAKSESQHKLVLKVSVEWAINSSNKRVVIEFPVCMADELIQGMAGLVKGSGDYFIGTAGNELWFWW